MLLELMIKKQFCEDMGSLTLSQVAHRRAFLGMSGSLGRGQQGDCTEALSSAVGTMMAEGDRREIPLDEAIGLL